MRLVRALRDKPEKASGPIDQRPGTRTGRLVDHGFHRLAGFGVDALRVDAVQYADDGFRRRRLLGDILFRIGLRNELNLARR